MFTFLQKNPKDETSDTDSAVKIAALLIHAAKIDEIYTDKESFLKEDLATETIRKKASKGQTIIPLSKVHEGTIAIVVYHDEDSNGELKTGLFWRPKEGFAFSNNYTPKGPPKFKKSAIKFKHGEPVEIKLNY